jgi:uncharacterized protein YeaO (DUF488 family)
MIRLKRAYEQPSTSDGLRVLVERLWPRGLRKTDAHLDAWMKDIAPSDELRRWFGHDPNRFREFRERYKRELRAGTARTAFDELARLAARRTVTLVYAAHDETHNNAVVLAREIDRAIARPPIHRRTRVPVRHAATTDDVRPRSPRASSRARSR